MTAVVHPDDVLDDDGADASVEVPRPDDTGAADGAPPAGGSGDHAAEGLRPVPIGAAAVLATAGGAVLVGNLFREPILATALGVLGAVLGAGLITESRRTDRSWLAWLPVPAALVLAAVVMTPAAGGGTANVPGLIRDALEAGGLEQAPVPFEAGWRGLIVILHALVAAAAATTAHATGRSRLAVVVPVPVLAGTALLQPSGREALPTILAGGLGIAALAAAYGADLAEAGATDRGFERQRLARGGLLLVGVLVLGGLVAQTGFLFPDTDRSEVIPPQRPPTPPPEPDRVVFRVTGDDTRGPWRLGVLDEYDGEALLLPSLDPDRIVEVDDGALAPAVDDTRTATVELTDLRGRVLPVEAGTIAIATENDLELDPRTGVVLNAAGRPSQGFTYEVTVAPRPGGTDFAAATVTTEPEILRFRQIPDPPPVVVELLRDAPDAPFDRLQFVRQQFYNRVVAAGVGEPVDVPVARAAALLEDGAEATPYEITVMEVLLARWSGLPARMGFGYFGGEESDDGGVEFRPRHGAAWLEVHYAELGWVPIVGTPPRAKESLSDELQNDDQQVIATQELAMVVYVPAEIESFTPLYETLRYWLTAIGPFVLAGILLLVGQPVARKVRRSWRRGRWAEARGPDAEILVAYAELRDRLHDLNIGDPTATPKEYLHFVAEDPEHRELAALVTRALWGDLRGRVGPADVAAAQDMALSVGRRIRSEQSGVNQVVAAVSVASVRNPYTEEIPNVGSDALFAERVRAAVRRVRLPLPRRADRFRPVIRRVATVTAVAALLAGTTALADTTTSVRGFGGARAAVTFPVAPPDTLGRYDVTREPTAEEVAFAEPDHLALVDDGRVYTLRRANLVDGSLQIARFRAEVDSQEPSIQDEVSAAIGVGRFDPVVFGPLLLGRQRLAEQTLWLWFPTDENVMVLFVFRADVDDDQAIVEEYVAHHLGARPAPPANPVNPTDPTGAAP